MALSSRDIHFSQIPPTNIQRSIFDRSHTYKTTFDAGYLVPFYLDEVLPGDSFKIKATTFARLNTPIVPFMDNLYLDTQFFFVPTRLLWKHWKEFNGERKKPTDSIDFTVPKFEDGTTFSAGSLGDYFGLPTGVALNNVNSLPFRAYNLIYNEWYRDENLIDSVYFDDSDTDDVLTNYSLLKRCKRHDYFTSCLPWPQKGDSVDIPLGETAPVYGVEGKAMGLNIGSSSFPMPGSSNSTLPDAWLGYSNGDAKFNYYTNGTTLVTGANISPKGSDIDSNVYVDLSNATAATINSLRQAFQIQRMLERDARGGSRYTEIIRSHFGVVSPDARLQRPEYLGGSSNRITINPVVQTSSTDSTSPQGNLSAFGVHGNTTNSMSRSFTEHGYIIGLVSVRADLTYQQGMNRLWSRRTRYDFYWPSLAHLGEQAVLNKEIFAQDDSVVDSDGNVVNDKVFGYQERYAEYRYFPNQITGKFRSTDAQPLDAWHLAQKFDNLPELGQTFIEENPPLDRVVSVPSEPDILFDSLVNVKAARPMPVYGVPGLIDHF